MCPVQLANTWIISECLHKYVFFSKTKMDLIVCHLFAQFQPYKHIDWVYKAVSNRKKKWNFVKVKQNIYIPITKLKQQKAKERKLP